MKSFDLSMYLWNHTANQGNEYINQPQKFKPSSFLSPGSYSSAVPISYFAFPKIVYKCKYILCPLFSSVSKSIIILRFIPVAWINTSLYYWIIFHYMNMPQFIFPSVNSCLGCFSLGLLKIKYPWITVY